jgi:GTPase SAR1 family protein
MMAQLQEFKVLFLGAAKTGKSHLRKILTRRDISDNYTPTLGVDVSPVRLFGNGNIYRANIWDCAGDKRYSGMQGGYYMEAAAVVIFKEDGSDGHVKYEKLLHQMGLNDIPKMYIDNYKNQNQTIEHWKQQMYNLLQRRL